MVRVLQTILASLRSKDMEGRARGQQARYWVLEDIEEFVQEFRAQAADLAKVPSATYDFSTMNDAVDHGTLLQGCKQAAKEAWAYEEQGVAAA